MNAMTPPVTAPDYDAIKTKQNAAWASGDYGKIGITLQLTGEQLAEALDLPVGTPVLDVAAGNGNATLALARRWCHVTSTDYAEANLENGRARALAEGHAVEFQVADAERLPFGDGEFDVVASSFGVMFTPDQESAASELVRACRSGGRIGLANWTPEGFVGRMFQTLGRHVPPPAGVASPARWGTRAFVDERFGDAAADVSFRRKHFLFVYPSPEHFLDFFRTYYGPMQKAFEALDEDGQDQLRADLLSLVAELNQATDGTMRVPAEYAEIVVTKA